MGNDCGAFAFNKIYITTVKVDLVEASNQPKWGPSNQRKIFISIPPETLG